MSISVFLGFDIFKSVMMLFRVIRLYDIKNEQRESSAAHVGTVSQTVRSGTGPYKEKYHARPALLTVFSITQSDHSISLLSVHDITDLNMLHKELQNLIERLDQPIKLMLTRKMATLKALFKSQNPYEMNSAFFSSILKI